jgi:hypothetical protein
MSTFDPGRSEERPPDQPGYPSAPPPQDYGQQGGYAGAPAQYGNAPQYGGGYGQQAAPTGPVPKEVDLASKLMFARVALGIISSILAFTLGDSIKESIRNGNPELTPSQVDSAYAFGIGVALFFGLLFALLYVLLAIQVRKGKNWARIVTLVLATLGVLSGLLGLVSDGPALERLVAVLLLLVDAAIIVLLLRKPSSEYFASRRAVR